MARWTHEAQYDALVAAEAAAQGVEPALIKAVIGAESAFTTTAKRSEPKIKDASYGLMQVLYGTARKLGYSGVPEGLFDPATNIHYGTRLLAENLNHTNGDVPSAVSAYNGGFRPALGFGTPFPNTGQFRNQVYVDRVLHNLAYFRAVAAPPAPDTPPGAAPTSGLALPALPTSGLLLGLALLGILWYLRTH